VKLVVDASIAIKWVISENGSAEALKLLKAAPLAAPDLLMAECANILWKKVQRTEMAASEAILCARLLQRADIEIYPTRHLLDTATELAIELNHPAYDCVYLRLAMVNGWRFVTADDRLLRKIRSLGASAYEPAVLSLTNAAAQFSP
jgi:predicted nucleic acid-binding protein